MTERAQLQAELESLSAGYAARLPEKLGQIDGAWAQLAQDGWDEQGFHVLHRLVHSLIGSGKTFGFARLSDAARDLGDYLGQVARAKALPDEGQCFRIRALLSELHQATRSPQALE